MPPLTTLRVAMDFFEHRYYRLSKTFMTLGGYWPYQNTHARYGIYVVFFFILISQIIPQTLGLVKYRDERAIVIDCIVTFLFEAICTIKGFGCLLNSGKTMELLNRIRADWQVWAQDREVNILHEYAEQGTEIYSVAFVYVAQPTIPKILDIILRNGTAPGEFPTPVDYYHLDSQKYYFYIIFYTYVCLCMGAIPFVASEIMLIMCVQHVCGIFAALGFKLQRMENNNTSVESGETSYALDKGDVADVASCIDRHNDAINCAKLIEATYTWTIFYMVACGTVMLNLVGLQILLGTTNPQTTIRFIGVALALVLDFFVECYISQLLMDHSIDIHLHIYNSQWYKLAPKAQNLLQFMIMRCSVSSKLTAGNFFNLSIRTFGQTMRTIASYFTVLRSIQL